MKFLEMVGELKTAWTAPFTELKNLYPDKIVDGVRFTLFPRIVREFRHKDRNCSVLETANGNYILFHSTDDWYFIADTLIDQDISIKEIKSKLDRGDPTTEIWTLDCIQIPITEPLSVVEFLREVR